MERGSGPSVVASFASDAKAKAAFDKGDAATGLGLLDEHAMAVGATATAIAA